jgi:hypothetical protein
MMRCCDAAMIDIAMGERGSSRLPSSIFHHAMSDV